MTARSAAWRASLLGVAALLAVTLPLSTRGEEPSPEAIRAELPFLEALPNQVKIDLGTPAGRRLPLLLDTGALHSFATAGAARELGISIRRNKQTPYRRGTRLGVPLEMHVDTRRSDTGTARGGDYALIGAPFLEHFVVEIDFPGRRVRFLDPARYEVPASDANASVLALRPGSTLPIVELIVGDTRVPAVIATGVPGTLILPGGWAAPEGAAVTIDADETARLELPPGGESMQAGRASRIRLGNFEERDVPLLVAPQGLWDQGARSDAYLGVDFLKRFVLRLDVTRGRLWIRDPALDASEAPDREPLSTPVRERPDARVRGVG